MKRKKREKFQVNRRKWGNKILKEIEEMVAEKQGGRKK
jgi:hypothetical protein